MRIRQLELQSFGHFEGLTINLDHPHNGLMFVVGPNEAGKSTLRSALRLALFGTSDRITAGRPTRDTSLAALLTTDEGEILLRRQGGKKAFRADGSQLADEDLRDLVKVSPDLFDHLFCLDHDALRRHAVALLQSDGGLGRIVFGAAFGGGNVAGISSGLQRQIDERFKPQGQTQLLVKELGRLRDVEGKLHALTITADVWAKQRDAIARLDAEISNLAAEREALKAKETRLTRIKGSAPNRAERERLRGEVETLLAAGPILSPEHLEGLANTRQAHRELVTDLNRLRGESERREARLAQINNDERLLGHSADVQALVEELASYRHDLELIRNHEIALETRDELPRPEVLLAAVTDLAAMNALATSLPEVEVDLAARRAAVNGGLSRLGITVAREAVASLPVPATEVIERVRREKIDRSQERARLRRMVDDHDAEIAAAQRRIAEVSKAQPVPSMAEIGTARVERDEGWRCVRQWFVEGQEPDAGSSNRNQAAARVDAALSNLDLLVDAVLNDTERAATVQSLRAKVQERETARQEALKGLVGLEALLAPAAEAWETLWQGVTVRVGTPEEMANWRNDWLELTRAIAELGAKEAHVEHAVESLAAGRKRLVEALTANGRPPQPDQNFLSLHARASALADEHNQGLEVARQVELARVRKKRVDQRIDVLLPLLDAEDVHGGEDAIRTLEGAWRAQSNARDERRRLGGELDEIRREQADKMLALAGRDKELERIAASVGTAIEDLDTVSERTRAVQELRGRIEDLERLLVEGGDGLSLDELCAEGAAAGSPDEIVARLDSINQKIKELQVPHDQRVGERATAKKEWEQIRGDADAAMLADEREQVLAKIARLTDETVVFTLAKALLDLAVDEARASGEGELVQRAGHFFQMLTDGEFERLDLETHHDVVYVVALRPNGGARLYPAALSDGTRDQLWLAWRLAGIEHHLKQVGTVPLIVDDVLVNFDDRRAGAAFAAFAELAAETQVVVLTHHPHLVEVARARLGEHRVAVTELGPRPQHRQPVVQIIANEEALSPEPPDVPKDPPTSSSKGSEDTKPTSAPVVGSVSKQLLAAIDDQWRGKSELVIRSGISESDWLATIKTLVTSGKVEQEGNKKGAKYRRN